MRQMRPGDGVSFYLACAIFVAVAYITGIIAHEVAWRLGRRGRKGWL